MKCKGCFWLRLLMGQHICGKGTKRFAVVNPEEEKEDLGCYEK